MVNQQQGPRRIILDPNRLKPKPRKLLDINKLKPKPRRLLLITLACVIGVGIAFIGWNPMDWGSGGGGDASGTARFTPNAQWTDNRQTAVEMRKDQSYIYQGSLYTVNNKTGESTEVCTLNLDGDSYDASTPAYFIGDYVYFLSSGRGRQYKLSRINLKTYKFEVEDKKERADEDWYDQACGLYYDGKFLYVARRMSLYDWFLEKYDPRTFAVVETIKTPTFAAGLNSMVWDGKYYSMCSVEYDDDYEAGAGDALYAYKVFDFKTGQESRLIPDKKVYASFLCADEKALYYITGELGMPSTYKVVSIKNGQESVLFDLNNVKTFYAEPVRDEYGYYTAWEPGKDYYLGIDEIFLDGDWMYVVLNVAYIDGDGYDEYTSHYLRIQTDGSKIQRINFPSREWTQAPWHKIAVSGEWMVEQGNRWQFKSNELVNINGKALDKPIPFDILKK